MKAFTRSSSSTTARPLVSRSTPVTTEVHLAEPVAIENVPVGCLRGEIIGEFNIHPDIGFIKPCNLIPKLVNETTARGTGRITDVREIERDAFREVYPTEKEFHDPTFRAVEEHSGGTSALIDVDLVSDRHSLRKLFKSCYPMPANGFYCKREDFTLLLHRKNGILTMCGAQEERWKPAPGGFGKGFERAMTHFDASHDQRSLSIESRYIRIQKVVIDGFSLVVRFEVDAVDAEGATVELKSRSEPNPRYPLTPDFFLNIWAQMALSNTKYVLIGFHRKGQITKVDRLSLTEVQARAGLSLVDARSALARLVRLLKWVHGHVPAEKNARLMFHAATDRYKIFVNEVDEVDEIDAALQGLNV